MEKRMILEGEKWDIPFDRKRPLPFVKHCRRNTAECESREEFHQLGCELTEEEKASPYAKYFMLGPAMPCQENIRATEYPCPCDPSKAFTIEDFTKRMDVEGCSELKTGYCILDNGVGFGMATTFVPGCTAEIMAHFLENYNPPYDLYYKTWFPGGHIRHYEDMAIEDVGYGMSAIRFVKIITEQEIGMPKNPSGDKYYIGCNGGNVLSVPLHQPEAEPIYTCEFCYYRLLPEGYEQRVVFWVGAHFNNGKTELHLPGGKPVDLIYPLSLARHSAWETATLMRNVMLFWEDSKK